MILMLFLRENATVPFLPSLSRGARSAEQQPHASFPQQAQNSTTEWSAGQIISHKGVFRSFVQNTKERLFHDNNNNNNNKNDNVNKTSTFPYFNHDQSLAAVLTSFICCYHVTLKTCAHEYGDGRVAPLPLSQLPEFILGVLSVHRRLTSCTSEATFFLFSFGTFVVVFSWTLKICW